MGIHNIRLGSLLSFDEEQEKDIVDGIEQLNATHKMGQFLSNIIRIAFDCPDVLDKSNGKFKQGAIVNQMEQLGMSLNRKQFMNQVSKDLQDMKVKIDQIYDMAYKTYLLAQFGNTLALEDKSNNQLLATFILEKQLKELQNKLGVPIKEQIYASSKLDAEHKKAEDELEYIINAYAPIIEHMTNTIKSIQTCAVTLPVNTQTSVQNNDSNISNKDITNNIHNNNKVVSTINSNDTDDENEFIDFGQTADLDALSNFFGD